MSTAPEPPDFPASQLFLRRLAFSLVRDAAQAEDLVQETWAAWVEHRPSGVVEPRAWLVRVLRNRAFNWKRSEARRTRREGLAGRPDPSTPETDGTLEAQAQLVEALRRIEEPYRSTLLQRYYHDLAPSTIAERSGAPLNTVKARLARGLEKLRAEMDRRYHGDRRAWCHWLTGAGPVGAAGVPDSNAGPGSDRWIPPLASTLRGFPTTAVGAGAVGKGLAFLALTLSGLGWVLWRGEREADGSSPVTIGEAAVLPAPALTPPSREPIPVVPGPNPSRAAPDPAPPPVRTPDPTAFAAPTSFQWPQLGGTPTHDAYRALGPRANRIHRPRVRFFLQGLAGQPTLRGTELYSGGSSLYRVDLERDEVYPASPALQERIRSSTGRSQQEHDWQARLVAQGLTDRSWVSPAPVLTGELVIARMVGDGSVSAFDRDLLTELWRWQPSEPGPDPQSGCWVGDRYLATHGRELVALRIADGKPAWRFELEEGDAFDTVPACDGDLVYVASTGGLVLAFDLFRGQERWRRETKKAVGWSLPIALEDRVVLMDHRGYSDKRGFGRLRAFQSYDGRELWAVSLRGSVLANAGTGPGLVLFANGAWSAETGEFAGGSETIPRELRGTPAWVGGTIARIEGREALRLRVAETGEVLWSFEPQDVELLDFVHTGERIYVVTSNGLACLEDDPEKGPAPRDFVLEDPDPERSALRSRKH